MLCIGKTPDVEKFFEITILSHFWDAWGKQKMTGGEGRDPSPDAIASGQANRRPPTTAVAWSYGDNAAERQRSELDISTRGTRHTGRGYVEGLEPEEAHGGSKGGQRGIERGLAQPEAIGMTVQTWEKRPGGKARPDVV